jgi:hypothetical protein
VPDRALPEGTAPHTDLVVRPERPGEQATGVEPWDPLTVVHGACGAACALRHLLRIDQQDGDAAGLQQRKERHPRDAGGCHGDGREATRGEPVRQGFQVGRGGSEAADWLRVITGRDRHEVARCTDGDARGVEVASGKLGWESRGGRGRFPLALRQDGLHHATGKSAAAGAAAVRWPHSATRDQVVAWHQWGRRGLPGPPSQPGTRHQGALGLDLPLPSAQRIAQDRLPVPSGCTAVKRRNQPNNALNRPRRNNRSTPCQPTGTEHVSSSPNVAVHPWHFTPERRSTMRRFRALPLTAALALLVCTLLCTVGLDAQAPGFTITP